jgi:hypothetical protein
VGPPGGRSSNARALPVFISEADWTEVADSALALALETLAAERELLQRTDLHRLLGLPGTLCRAFARATEIPETASFARTMRFDFHFTRDGWRVSEVNSDVPGGFSEAEGFAGLMARYFLDARVAGRPASLWADRVAATLASDGTVALLSHGPFHVSAHRGRDRTLEITNWDLRWNPRRAAILALRFRGARRGHECSA